MRLVVIILILSLGLGSCGDENEAPEVGPLRSTPMGSTKLIFYSISTSDGEDIFSQEDYFLDSLKVSFRRPISPATIDPDEVFTFDKEELLIVQQDDKNLIGLAVGGLIDTYFFDFGSGMIDTLGISNGEFFDSFDAFSWDTVSSGEVGFYFNGQLVQMIELIPGTNEYEDLRERIQFFTLDEDWSAISDLFIVNLLKE